MPRGWDSLPWKSLDVPLERDDGWTGADGDGGGALVCALEEIDGSAYEISKSEDGGGFTIRMRSTEDNVAKKVEAPQLEMKSAKKKRGREPKKGEEGAAAPESAAAQNKKKKTKKMQKRIKQEEWLVARSETLSTNEHEEWQLSDAELVEMLHWSTMGFELHPLILYRLFKLGFHKPTPIQQSALPKAILGRRDIIAAAETGSGKTLSFAIPIVQSLLVAETAGKGLPLQGLVLCPTRELAMQVVAHTKDICEGSKVQVVAVVGGMAEVKQERLLKRRPEIVVATPGRLWELMQTNSHLGNLANLKFLIIDEADRMIERGRYAELKKLLSLLAAAPTSQPSSTTEQGGAAKGEVPSSSPSVKRQTIILSATLALGSAGRQSQQHRARTWAAGKEKSGNVVEDGESALKDIMERAGVKGKPAILDLSHKKNSVNPSVPSSSDIETGAAASSSPSTVVLPDGLHLSAVKSLQMDKDAWLYLFLLQYPGRSIVFLNSIKLVRRLAHILQLLRVPCHTLHAQMQQKQRLKSVERLQAEENAVLIATDVAARGLDVPNVQHVIHYDVPRSVDTFIHRSGRTARGGGTGFALTIVTPHDEGAYKQLCDVLNKPVGLDAFSVPSHLLDRARERVLLAVRIARYEAKLSGQKAENTYLEQTMDAADILPDDEMEACRKLGGRHEKVLVKESSVKLRALLAAPLHADRRKFLPTAELLKETQRKATMTAAGAAHIVKKAKPARRR